MRVRRTCCGRLLDDAKAGDRRAAEILLRWVWPERKGRLVEFDLPPVITATDAVKAAAAIVAAVATGGPLPTRRRPWQAWSKSSGGRSRRPSGLPRSRRGRDSERLPQPPRRVAAMEQSMGMGKQAERIFVDHGLTETKDEAVARDVDGKGPPPDAAL